MTTLTEIANFCEANGWTDPAIAHAAMSVMTTQVDADIEVADVVGYLLAVGNFLPIKLAANADSSGPDYSVAADMAMETFNRLTTYQLTHPTMGAAYKTALESQIDALIAGGFVDATDKAVIMGMGVYNKPDWPDVTETRIATALQERSEGKI